MSIVLNSSKGADGTVVMTVVNDDPGDPYGGIYSWYLNGALISGVSGDSMIAPSTGIYYVTEGGVNISNVVVVLSSTQTCGVSITHPLPAEHISPVGYLEFDVYADGIDLPTTDYINVEIYTDAGSPGSYSLIDELYIGSEYITTQQKTIGGHIGWSVRVENYHFTPCSAVKIVAKTLIP